MTDQPAQGPEKVWAVRGYQWSRYPNGAWEFSDGMLGSGGRGPIRAFANWLRWRRRYRSRPPGYWAE